MTPLGAWVLGVMTALQPGASWKTTYPATAEAFATVAREAPLFEGEQKVARTAALFLAISYYESRFRNDVRGGHGRFLCLMQVSRDNLPPGGAARVLRDPEACVRAALPVLRRSLASCASHPEPDRLALYTAGSCSRGAEASRGRYYLSRLLLRKYREGLPDEPPEPPALHL